MRGFAVLCCMGCGWRWSVDLVTTIVLWSSRRMIDAAAAVVLVLRSSFYPVKNRAKTELPTACSLLCLARPLLLVTCVMSRPTYLKTRSFVYL